MVWTKERLRWTKKLNRYSSIIASESANIAQGRSDQIVDTKDGKKFSVYDNLDVSFAEAAVIKPPTVLDIIKVLFTRQTLMQCACYFCTFGGELAINSNLSSFYIKSSGTPPWTQTYAANWAAMYGLLNVVTRPMGGFIGDLLYPVAGIEGKKFWMIACISPPQMLGV